LGAGGRPAVPAETGGSVSRSKRQHPRRGIQPQHDVVVGRGDEDIAVRVHRDPFDESQTGLTPRHIHRQTAARECLDGVGLAKRRTSGGQNDQQVTQHSHVNPPETMQTLAQGVIGFRLNTDCLSDFLNQAIFLPAAGD
jgi:hypothetical protein